MNKMIKGIVYILFGIVLCAIIFFSNNSYATTNEEKEELISLLNEYKDDLGNLNQFKEVVDALYNDINSATTVTDELKEKLNEDIDKLSEVEGINPLILQTLQIELKSQVEDLDDSNLSEVKEEIKIIKDWVDENVENSNNSGDNTNNNQNNGNINNGLISGIDANNYANKILPYAGGIKTVIILSIIAVLSIIATVSIIKYKNFKDIK